MATYLPGRRVRGVRISTDRAEVHVVLVYPTPVEEAAAAVRVALAGVVDSPVDVVVDEVVTDEELAAGELPRQNTDRPEVGT